MTKERRTLSVRLDNKVFKDPVAVGAAVIAFCALFATIWQGLLMKEHNRKSMLPYLDIHHNFALPDEWLGASISNEGPGMAIVQAVSLKVDGKAIPAVERNGWPAALAELGLKKRWVKYRHFNPGDVLRSGDERPLMGSSTYDDDKKKALREKVRRLTVQVCYCSVYDECFSIEDQYRGETIRRNVGSCPQGLSEPLERAKPEVTRTATTSP